MPAMACRQLPLYAQIYLGKCQVIASSVNQHCPRCKNSFSDWQLFKIDFMD